MERYAFVNAENTVVNVISGALTPEQQQEFLAVYAAVFNAIAVIEVLPETPVWIGGTYTDGVFQPAPDPQPEPLPEPQPEPEI